MGHPWPITQEMVDSLNPILRKAYLEMDEAQRRHVAEAVWARTEQVLLYGNGESASGIADMGEFRAPAGK